MFAEFLKRARPAQTYTFGHESVLGTSLDLHIDAASLAEAQAAEERALGEIDRLERIFSRYDPESEFRHWQETPGVAVALSPELLYVLEVCEQWRAQSGGAFDPAGEAFLELWRAAARREQAPAESEIEALRARTARTAWTLCRENGTAIRHDDYALSLNSVAKGFIIDAVCDVVMRESGVSGAVVNIGGDLRVAGNTPRRVGVGDPFHDAENALPIAILSLENAAMATSGDGRRGFAIGETWYSHLIDPRTGHPVSRVCSASVVAPDAMTADILATVFSIAPPEESIVMADELPGVACLVIEREGKTYCSDGWRSADRPK